MPRFFVPQEQITDQTVIILGDDAHHVSRALRMAVGEHITVCDMQGNDYECELSAFLPDRVEATILSSSVCASEPPYRACVYQALPKGDKLDSIIQKAVECGAATLTTFESERCIVRLKGENENKKVERRQRIALEAAKQSGRGIVPAVYPTVPFMKAVEEAAKADLALFCYEGEGTEPLSSAIERVCADWKEDTVPTVSLMIGSEGGFSPAEAEAAKRAGMIPVGLGKRILRTETASGFVLSCLVYALELKKNAKIP